MACQSSGCEMVGSDVRYESAETDSISPAGVPGTLRRAHGSAVGPHRGQLPRTTCVAGGDGILTSFTPGSTDWATLSAGTSADALVGLACTVTLYCQVVSYTAGTGSSSPARRQSPARRPRSPGRSATPRTGRPPCSRGPRPGLHHGRRHLFRRTADRRQRGLFHHGAGRSDLRGHGVPAGGGDLRGDPSPHGRRRRGRPT